LPLAAKANKHYILTLEGQQHGRSCRCTSHRVPRAALQLHLFTSRTARQSGLHIPIYKLKMLWCCVPSLTRCADNAQRKPFTGRFPNKSLSFAVSCQQILSPSFITRHVMKTYTGTWGIAPPFLTSEMDESEWSAPGSCRFNL
jgi:hypothetical protein